MLAPCLVYIVDQYETLHPLISLEIFLFFVCVLFSFSVSFKLIFWVQFEFGKIMHLFVSTIALVYKCILTCCSVLNTETSSNSCIHDCCRIAQHMSPAHSGLDNFCMAVILSGKQKNGDTIIIIVIRDFTATYRKEIQ